MHSNSKQLLKYAFFNGAGTLFYIVTISYVLNHSWFSVMGDKILGSVIFLTLLIISAAVTGSLVLGRPLYLVVQGKIRDATFMLISTILFLAVFVGLLPLVIRFA